MLAQLSYNGKYNIPKADLELCVKLSNRDETFNGAFFSKLSFRESHWQLHIPGMWYKYLLKNSTSIGKKKFGQI